MQLLHTENLFCIVMCGVQTSLLNTTFYKLSCGVKSANLSVCLRISILWVGTIHASLCRMNSMAWAQSIIMYVYIYIYIYIHSIPQPLHLIDCTYIIICPWHTFMNLIGFFLSSHHLIKLEGKISEMDRPHINKILCHCSIRASHLTPTKIIS
jgi:hypothetical protein